MKKLLSLSVLASALVLTACGGGSSDSSGSTTTTTTTTTTPTTTTPTTTTPSTTTPSTNSTTCVGTGSTVYATSTGCTYSVPNLNGGALVTYTCSGDRVSSSIGINAKTINLNGITIMCKP